MGARAFFQGEIVLAPVFELAAPVLSATPGLVGSGKPIVEPCRSILSAVLSDKVHVRFVAGQGEPASRVRRAGGYFYN